MDYETRSQKTLVPLAAALLDQEFPGWAEWIDRARLDMRIPENCIGGQLCWHYFRFQKHMSKVFGNHLDWYEPAYQVREQLPGERQSYEENNRTLIRLWLQQIANRIHLG